MDNNHCTVTGTCYWYTVTNINYGMCMYMDVQTRSMNEVKLNHSREQEYLRKIIQFNAYHGRNKGVQGTSKYCHAFTVYMLQYTHRQFFMKKKPQRSEYNGRAGVS